jgi:sterol desaturase/sphingolipid hydroxylase (fatty acid hydroxylase superfamily)
MPAFAIEHSPERYRADFIAYAAAVAALAAWLALRAPAGLVRPLLGFALAGVAIWSVLEYALHRFVLHGLQPFARWHGEHHRRPAALIGTPTLVSAPLFGLLVALPSVWLLGPWRGAALTLGVLAGYLAYASAHHALHHWRLSHPWWQRRKFAHARHHHLLQPCCFGVTSGFWDGVFRTAGHKTQRRAPVRVHIPVVRRRG